ncbi:MAG: hypothetical protein MJA82_18675 [Clostridia bacterium]|nr:hypothetical protein [Clostridia bacterium]
MSGRLSIKDIVVKLFYEEGLNVTEIAKHLDISKQAISKHLIKHDPVKYNKEKDNRKIPSWIELAIKLFYNEGLTVKEVAEKVDKSSTYISKMLSNYDSERYQNEKSVRRKKSGIKEKIRKRKWKKNNYKSKVDVDHVLIKKQHEIDVKVFSKGGSSNVSSLHESGYLQSAYSYNEKNNKYTRNGHVDGALIPTSLPKNL